MIFTKKGAIKYAREVCDLPILNCYKNGNHYTTIFSDGTRVREPIGFSRKLVYTSPENMDIKISDQCPIGCKYCHESSTPNGKIGDIMNKLESIKKRKITLSLDSILSFLIMNHQ